MAVINRRNGAALNTALQATVQALPRTHSIWLPPFPVAEKQCERGCQLKIVSHICRHASIRVGVNRQLPSAHDCARFRPGNWKPDVHWAHCSEPANTVTRRMRTDGVGKGKPDLWPALSGNKKVNSKALPGIIPPPRANIKPEMYKSLAGHSATPEVIY